MRRGRESEDSDEEMEVSGDDGDDQKSSVSDFSEKNGEDYDINEYKYYAICIWGISVNINQNTNEAEDSSDNEKWKDLAYFDEDYFKRKGEGKKNLREGFDDGDADAEDCSKFINYEILKNWKEEEHIQSIRHLFVTGDWEEAKGRNEVPESNTEGDDAVYGDFEEGDTNLMQFGYGKTPSTSTKTLNEAQDSSDNENWKGLSFFDEDFFKRKGEGKKNLREGFDDGDADADDCSKFINYENLKNWEEEEHIQSIRHSFVTGDWEKARGKNEVPESNTEGDDAVYSDFEDLEGDTNLMQLVYAKTPSTSTKTLNEAQDSSDNEDWKGLSYFDEDYFKRKGEGKKNLREGFDDGDANAEDCSKFINYENLKNWEEEEHIQSIRHLFVTGDWEEAKGRNEVPESNTEGDDAVYGDFEDLEGKEHERHQADDVGNGATRKEDDSSKSVSGSESFGLSTQHVQTNDFTPSAPAIAEEGLDEGLTYKPSSSSCEICSEAPLEAVCVPCGHLTGCVACLLEIEAKNGICPVCQGKINSIFRIYVT